MKTIQTVCLVLGAFLLLTGEIADGRPDPTGSGALSSAQTISVSVAADAAVNVPLLQDLLSSLTSGQCDSDKSNGIIGSMNNIVSKIGCNRSDDVLKAVAKIIELMVGVGLPLGELPLGGLSSGGLPSGGECESCKKQSGKIADVGVDVDTTINLGKPIGDLLTILFGACSGSPGCKGSPCGGNKSVPNTKVGAKAKAL